MSLWRSLFIHEVTFTKTFNTHTNTHTHTHTLSLLYHLPVSIEREGKIKVNLRVGDHGLLIRYDTENDHLFLVS